MFMKHYAPNRCESSIEVIMKRDVNEEVKFCENQKKKNWGGGGVGGGRGCVQRSEVFVEIKTKSGGGGGGR